MHCSFFWNTSCVTLLYHCAAYHIEKVHFARASRIQSFLLLTFLQLVPASRPLVLYTIPRPRICLPELTQSCLVTVTSRVFCGRRGDTPLQLPWPLARQAIRFPLASHLPHSRTRGRCRDDISATASTPTVCGEVTSKGDETSMRFVIECVSFYHP